MLSRAEFRGAGLAVAGLLVLIYLLIALSPGLPGELLLQTLRFHFAAVGFVVAVAIMVVGARMRGALFLLVTLASTVHGAAFVRDFYERRTDLGVPAAQFRFLNFNVLSGNRNAEELVEAVLADPPDVMLVMETPGVERYLDRLAEVFPYRLGCDISESCDISLHSRFPLEEGSLRNLPPFGHERLVIARITVEGQGVTIAGLHLSKPYFDQAAWVELYAIRGALQDIAGPMLISGDFNAAPWSEPVANLGNVLDLVPGPWPAATWPVPLGWLGVPIDNVFTRGNARVLTLQSGESFGSNHRPLWAEVGLYAE